MHRYLTLLFLFFLLNALGQKDSVLVILEISDKQYGDPVPNVNLTLIGSQKTLYKRSNQQGRVLFYWSKESCSINMSHPLYESETVGKKINLQSDSVKFQLQLNPIKTLQFKEVVIKPIGVPDTVYSSGRLSVADFEIQKNGDLILLVYPKQLKKGSEMLLYDGIEVINSFNIPGQAEELVRDYRGNAHVICKENVYGIHVNNEKIGISSLEKDYYLKYLAPILDTNHTKMYFSNFSEDYPAFSYFSFDQLDSTYRKICNIKDDLMMELYRSEYKWVDVRTKLWAKNKEYETGIDAEIWVGANYFTQSIYYKELYAPMFHRNDTLFVFDYYKDQLYSFNSLGDKIDSIPIYHHYHPKSTGWKKQLIQDKITGEIFAVFDKSGFTYLGNINTATGEIKEMIRLEFRYIDKITVHNNKVYYIYRPFESIQKKFLYSEKLPGDFKPSKVPYGDVTDQ